MDEATTRKYYNKLAQKDPRKAGALHTILADGVWTPQRTHKRQNNSNGDCLLCGMKNAGVNRRWWDCYGLQNQSEYSFVRLKEIRNRYQNQPECFWNTGVVTADWTTLPETEHMRDVDICHECKGVASTVYIDGSSYKFSNSSYSGWGIWSPDNPMLSENGPLKGKSKF